MKRILKKNQMMIAALAVMIAAAGYLNYSGKIFPKEKKAQETGAELANQELLDISEEDLEANASTDIESQDKTGEDGSVEGTPGEAVLTSGTANAVVAEAKVTREQVRAKNKETLMELINNGQIPDTEKQAAIQSMIRMTEISEKENAAETLLRAKGFVDPVVSITEDQVDVVVNAVTLTDPERAQIEDIVKRKTEVGANGIVITLMDLAE